MSRAEQQTIFLQERQLQFKKAALNAKQNGDMELAKKYLRSSKVKKLFV
jgi:coiled-coil and C2 domain-containing protein 1